MSLVPILLNEILGDYKSQCPAMSHSRCPAMRDLHDQNFGLGLTDLLHHPPSSLHPQAFHHVPLKCGYLRPWRQTSPSESGVSSLTNDPNEFKINLDVQQFKPEELKVTVDDGYLVVNGKHAEKLDEHGFISREFTRRYKIPEDVDPNQLASKLSSDGVLSLHAPKMVKEESKAREIPITHTNQPIRIKEDKKKVTKSDDAMATN